MFHEIFHDFFQGQIFHVIFTTLPTSQIQAQQSTSHKVVRRLE